MHICASSHLQRWNYVYCVYIFYCCNELKNSQQQRTFKYICRCTPEDVGCPKSTTFWSQQWCASLTTKAWSRLLHFDLLVKIFAFTPRYCVNQVTCLLHACCWVITVCLKTFNLFEVFFATFGATKSIKCRSWRGVTTIRQTRQWSAKIVNLYFGQQQPRRVNNILKTIFCPFDVDFICYASWSRVWPICHSLACFTKSSKGCS